MSDELLKAIREQTAKGRSVLFRGGTVSREDRSLRDGLCIRISEDMGNLRYERAIDDRCIDQAAFDVVTHELTRAGAAIDARALEGPTRE